MLFAIANFNVFTGVFDVTNCIKPVLNYVRQNCCFCYAPAFDYPIQIFCVEDYLLYLQISNSCSSKAGSSVSSNCYGLAQVINYTYILLWKENLCDFCKATKWQKLGGIVFKDGKMQFYNNLPHQIWFLTARSQFFIMLILCTTHL